MAAKKKSTRNTKAKKPTRSPNQRKEKSVSSSPLLAICLYVCIVGFALLGLFQLGPVGRLFYHIVDFIGGNAAPAIYLALIAFAGWKLFTPTTPLPRRYPAGALCFLSAWQLHQAIGEFSAPAHALQEELALFLPIFSNLATTDAGLIGALLYFLFGQLFEADGCRLIVGLLCVLGVILCGYSFFVSFFSPENRQQRKAKFEAHKAALQEQAAKRQERKAEREKQAALLEAEKPKTTKNKSFRIIEADQITEFDPEGNEIKKKSSRFVPDAEPEPVKPTDQGQLPLEADEEEAGLIHFPPDDPDEIKPAKKSGKSRKKSRAPAEPELDILFGEPAGNPKPSQLPDPAFSSYVLPKLNLLQEVSRKGRRAANTEAAREQGRKLIELLHQFSIGASLQEVHIGPSVTKFEITLDPGVRVSRISSLQGDIKMALAATDIRIEAPIPGKSAVGIEIPNVEKTTVQMKEVMRDIPERLQKEKLLICLGKDLMGDSVFGLVNKMPHLLIAGATGSGKSVCVNSIICSLLLRTRPDEVKLILIDPKKVEFTPYNNVPHLLAPVITDADLASSGLKVVVRMMDHRYDLFEQLGVRNIEAYNNFAAHHPEEGLEKLPRIVVIIDELADLMLAAAKEVEQSIQRITQLARAAGIHLIVATQRPSVDVITGIIKANIPSRIAFAVSSAVDSRTILDQAGAEKLLGYGDMLYLPNGETSASRVQGVFIQDQEVSDICDYVKTQGIPAYDDAFIQLKDLARMDESGHSSEPADPLYQQVQSFVISARRASTSLIQRKFSIGYARAARLMDVLEENGIIGPANGSKPRQILVQNTLDDSEETL